MKKIFAALYYVLAVLILITTMTHCTKSKTCYCIRRFASQVYDPVLYDSVGPSLNYTRPRTFTEEYTGKHCAELNEDIVDSSHVKINGTLHHMITVCNDKPTVYVISQGTLYY